MSGISSCDARPPINAEMKVSVLLEHYPHLEEVLLSLTPAFEKLTNPALRKTIAKIATLEQASHVGKIQIDELLSRLRKQAGFSSEESSTAPSQLESPQPPEWFDTLKVKKTLDARPILASGEHPLAQVLTDLSSLSSGSLYEMITPFIPAPLLDKVREMGYGIWSIEESDGLIRNYFSKL